MDAGNVTHKAYTRKVNDSEKVLTSVLKIENGSDNSSKSKSGQTSSFYDGNALTEKEVKTEKENYRDAPSLIVPSSGGKSSRNPKSPKKRDSPSSSSVSFNQMAIERGSNRSMAKNSGMTMYDIDKGEQDSCSPSSRPRMVTRFSNMVLLSQTTGNFRHPKNSDSSSKQVSLFSFENNLHVTNS